jgi:hypothetical protein
MNHQLFSHDACALGDWLLQLVDDYSSRRRVAATVIITTFLLSCRQRMTQASCQNCQATRPGTR